MKQDFNFNTPNKRLPYTVPEGFFTDLESRILAATVDAAGKTDADIETDTEAGHTRATGSDNETANRPVKHTLTLRRWLVAATAAAALVAVALLPRQSDTQPVTLADVEQTFAQLSDEDQAELLALYQNDPFINL